MCGASWAGDSGQGAGVGVDFPIGVLPANTLTVTLGASPQAPEQKWQQPLREGKRGRDSREQEDEMASSGH